MKCSNPIDAVVLADYWLEVLADSEVEAVDLHLLDCDQCGTRLREVIALAEGIRKIAREGSLRMVVSDTFLQRAAAEGLRIREYAPPRRRVRAPAAAGAGLSAAFQREGTVEGTTRVDLCFCDEQGLEQFRLPDIPIHAAADGVVFQESITFAKAAPTNTMIARLVSIDERGSERLLGEYTFHHTRSLPGPGAW